LTQVRNPWGDFEWKGDFSDGSRMWLKHPEVATACKYDPHSANANDGTFWMLYEVNPLPSHNRSSQHNAE